MSKNKVSFKLTSNLMLLFLVFSLFYNSLVLQYFFLFTFILFWIITKKGKVVKSSFLWFPIIIVPVGAISWFSNMLLGNADSYSFLFWLVYYLPNFLLTILLITYSVHLDFYKIYRVYKFLVYIQSFLLIFTSVKHGVYQVGDAAAGTLGNANFVAFHILLVILYEIISVNIKLNRGLISIQRTTLKFLEISYFSIVFMIPGSDANFGFLVIIIFLFLLKEYLLKKLNILKIALIVGMVLLGSVLLSNTLPGERILHEVDLISDLDLDLDKDPYFAKFNIYKKIITGEIINGKSVIFGLGPATFTSRSSLFRMSEPEERTNNYFSLDIPYFMSDHFAKFISPFYLHVRTTGISYSSFSHPQTSVVSIAVELGLLGLYIFFSYFYFIFKRIKKANPSPEDEHLRKFAFYLNVYFIMSLFHLNFWEHPFMSFTYIIFTFLTLFPKKN